MRDALAPHDLTHVQFVLLACTWWLGRSGEPPTQAAIARQAGTDPMMTSQVIRRLEQAGLLERRRDDADGRARRIALTPAGDATLSGALAAVEAADADYFAALGDRTAAFAADLGRLAGGRG